MSIDFESPQPSFPDPNTGNSEGHPHHTHNQHNTYSQSINGIMTSNQGIHMNPYGYQNLTPPYSSSDDISIPHQQQQQHQQQLPTRGRPPMLTRGQAIYGTPNPHLQPFSSHSQYQHRLSQTINQQYLPRTIVPHQVQSQPSTSSTSYYNSPNGLSQPGSSGFSESTTGSFGCINPHAYPAPPSHSQFMIPNPHPLPTPIDSPQGVVNPNELQFTFEPGSSVNQLDGIFCNGDLNDEDEDEDNGGNDSSTLTSPTKKYTKPPPRPPNAWIIYRSDRLKDIAEKKPLPLLDEVMAEHGVSSSSGSHSPELEGESSNKKEDGDAEGGGGGGGVVDGKPVKKKKPKKPKKGAKEPSEGLLNLGKGKTGRGIPQADISRLISLMWAREPPDVKKQYEKQSELQKVEHQRKYPNYKFQPKRKADKQREREERDREKQEIRRLKELEKQNGGVKRKGRTKATAASPYGATVVRGKQQYHGHIWQPQDVNAEHKFAAYPFPINAENLPSLRQNGHQFPTLQAPQAQHVILMPQAGPSSQTLHQMPARSPLPGQPGPSHRSDLMMPPAGIAPPPPPHDYPQQAVNIQGMGSAIAVPIMFDPIPTPADQEFSFDDLGPMEEMDPEALAAMFCEINEQPADGVSSDWAEFSADIANWDFGNLPTLPGAIDLSSSFAEEIANAWNSRTLANNGYTTEGYQIPIYNPEHDYLQIAYIDPQLNQMGQDAQLQHHSSQTSPVDPTTSSNPTTIAPLSIQVNRSNGSFLTPSQPVSPFDGSWGGGGGSENSPFRSNSITYTTSAINTPGSESSSRNPSFSENQNQNQQQLPRYVSSSAFPDTPLSTGGGNGSPNQNDRITSFSALTAQTSDAHSTDLDNIWEEEQKNGERNLVQPNQMILRQTSTVVKSIDPSQNQTQLSVSTGAPEKTSNHNTPSVIPSPPMSGVPPQSEYEASKSGNSSSDSTSRGPPRSLRRGRVVGQAFVESGKTVEASQV